MADQILQASVTYKTNPNFLMREIGGECVLVPVGQAVTTLWDIHMRNPTA